MGGVDFETIGGIAGFLAAVWGVGRLLKTVGMSPVVGEILVGMVLGPKLANFVPLVEMGGSAAGDHRRLQAESGASELSLWVYLGIVGVTLLIAESGLHMDFETIKKVGPSAMGVATLGTTLPIAFAILFMWVLKYDVYPDGLSAGCSLAPTSIGIALKLLAEVKQLNSAMGQTIITSAFLDDIMSLVALAILMDLSKGNLTAWGVARPIVLCIVFIVVTGLGAYHVFPKAVPKLLGLLPPTQVTRSRTRGPREEVHLLLMFAVICVYCYIGSFVGSHLLGAFMGGMSFCKVPRSMMVWTAQMKRLNQWLIRIFFACTVGFSIPIDEMMSLEAFWKGMVLAAVPCILGKLVSGFWLDTRFIVGAAMMGRGEFAYLVAESARTTEYLGGSGDAKQYMLSNKAYASVVWALLTATVSAPFLFKYLLGRRFDHHIDKRATMSGITSPPGAGAGRTSLSFDTSRKANKYWKINICNEANAEPSEKFNINCQQLLLEGLMRHGLDVIGVEMSADNEHDYEVYEVIPLQCDRSIEGQADMFQPDYDILEDKIRREVEAVVAGHRAIEKWDVETQFEHLDGGPTSSLQLHNISFRNDPEYVKKVLTEYETSPTMHRVTSKDTGATPMMVALTIKEGENEGTDSPRPLQNGSRNGSSRGSSRSGSRNTSKTNLANGVNASDDNA